jgi:hypothetical protein
VTPTFPQRSLAYIANGNLPPLPGLSPIALDALATFALSVAACLTLGVLLGSAIAP